MAVLFRGTANYSTMESWLYDRIIAPAAQELAAVASSMFLPGIRSGSSLLDIGCGGGHLADYMRQCRPDLSVFGIDLSFDQVDRAANRCTKGARPALFVLGTALALPYADGCFDTVVSVASIKHWPDKARGLQECVRVLKPGGELFVAEIDRECSLDRARDFVAGWRVPAVLRPAALQVFKTSGRGRSIDRQEARTLLDALDLTESRIETIPQTPAFMMSGKRGG